MRLETYQLSKHWYQHRLQNECTSSCNNYNFEVLKLQFVALSSPYPRCYCKTYLHPRGITTKTFPIHVELLWYPSPSPWDYHGTCGNPAVPINVQLSSVLVTVISTAKTAEPIDLCLAALLYQVKACIRSWRRLSLDFWLTTMTATSVMYRSRHQLHQTLVCVIAVVY